MKNHQNGQSIVEYILVTAFVALAAIAIFKGFRSTLTDVYDKAGQAILQGVNDGLDDPAASP